MEQNYLDILEDSLNKKKEVLDKIIELNEKQKECLCEDNIQLESFDLYIDEKNQHIKLLEQLDVGFEVIYSKVEDELKNSREQYADNIRRMQQLIRDITDKSASIQVQELRNRNMINMFFGRKRNEIKDGRRSTKAAMNYYNVQSSVNAVTPQFMDKKK